MPVKKYDGTNWVTVAGDGAQGPTGPAGASATTVVTTKGDLLGYSTTAARLPVGTNGQVLTADSAETTGLKWSTPVPSSMTLINTGGTALSGATTTISSIPNTYKSLVIYVTDFYPSVQGSPILYFNTDSTASNYSYIGTRLFGSSYSTAVIGAQGSEIVYIGVPAADNNNNLAITIPNYAETTSNKIYTAHSGVIDNGGRAVTFTAHRWNNTAAISSINFNTGSGGGTWSGGTIYVYGVN